MTKISDMIESKYLKQSDVHDDTVVTIVKIGKANIAKEGDEPEMKWLCRFNEFPKPMVLNSTNIKRLGRACETDEIEGCIGKQVMLYVDPDVEFAGNVVGGLRIRAISKVPQIRQVAPPQTGGRFDDIKDDIPF